MNLQLLKMPISAEQWRAATGSLNSGKGSFKQKPRTSAKLGPTLDGFPSPPPTQWKGYYTVMVLLSAPLMYRMYLVGMTVMMYLVGPSRNQGTHIRFSTSHHYNTISIGMVVDVSNSESSILDSVGGGVLCLSLNAVLYVAMVMMVLLIGVRDSRESDKYRWKLIAQRIDHLDSLDLLFWLFSGLECDSIIFDTSIGTLHQVHRTPSPMKTKKTNQSALLGVISPHFILQLSTLVVAMLLLLAGDVERNPGPVTKLDMSDHFEVCRHLKVMDEKQLRELGGALGLHFPNLTKMSDLPAQMVAAWLRIEDSVRTKSGPPSWESLIKALRRIGQNGIADKIEEEYGSETNLTSKPGKPEAYDIGHNSLSLRWTEPEYGGDSVIGYITYYKEESSDADWKQQESEITDTDMVIGGLTPGKKYIFKIQPICMDKGVGARSDISDPIETKSTSSPGKPVVSECVTHDSIAICWTAPKYAKNLVGYVIYYRTKDDPIGSWKTCKVHSSSIVSQTINKLQAKTKYVFKVSSTCSNGIGAESECSEPIETKPLLCKPGKPEAADGEIMNMSICLKWNKPEHGKVVNYTVRYQKVGSTQWIQETAAKNSIKLEQLEHKTEYHIQVYPHIEAESRVCVVNEWSEPTTIRTKHIQCMKEKSRLIERGKPGCPDVYQVPIETVSENKRSMIRKCFVGEDAVQQTTFRSRKVILLVGATGTGKTTLINGLVNHVLGVKWEHSYRFKMIVEASQSYQTKSQTKWITSYTIQEMEESPIKYPLTIIDTPGFGDAEGIVRDQRLVEQIRAFFSTKEIDQIHAIGLVSHSLLARLTIRQKYIFHFIFSLFGNDVKDNIFMLTTFADGQPPPVLQAVKEAGVPYHKAFKFNNSALFANNGATSAFDKMFWEMGKTSFNEFFDELSQTTPKSLTLTKEVLKEREHLEVSVEGLLQQVRAGLSKVDALRQEEDILRKHDAQLRENKEFTYTIIVPTYRKVDLDPGTYVTNCLTCNYTCHDPCYVPPGCLYRCPAMDNNTPDAQCTICPGKCHWKQHVNTPYRYESYKVSETKTSEELKRRYHHAKSGKLEAENKIAELKKELNKWYEGGVKNIDQMQQSIKHLLEIALKPNPLLEVRYIELLIESERQEVNTGYEHRIQSLEKLKVKAKLLEKPRPPPYSSRSGAKPWESLLQFAK